MRMIHRASLGLLALVTFAGARAHDATKYPDLSGQWMKPGRFGDQWDPTKPLGFGQQAPLTAEYQKVLEASLADQKAGGQGGDTRITCRPNGMPRMMTPVRPMSFLVEPATTYILFEINMPHVASTRMAANSQRTNCRLMRAIRSGSGSTRTAMAGSMCSRLRPVISKGRAPSKPAAFLCMRITNQWSRNGFSSTRRTKTCCTT